MSGVSLMKLGVKIKIAHYQQPTQTGHSWVTN